MSKDPSVSDSVFKTVMAASMTSGPIPSLCLVNQMSRAEAGVLWHLPLGWRRCYSSLMLGRLKETWFRFTQSFRVS